MSAAERNAENKLVSKGWPHSLWIDTTPGTDYPALEADIEVDTAVLGGGIVGITVATFLKEAGQKIALVEMRKIAKGVTGHSTAKVTALHGLKYQKLLSVFPVERARNYAEANQTAIEKVASFVSRYDIDCDFKRTPAFTYTESKENLDIVKREVDAMQKLGMPSYFVDEAPIPFDIRGAVRLDGQAQFHPRKYLLALADRINGDGCYIFENTTASNIKDDEPCIITTLNGTIRAKNVVVATTFPFYDTGGFYAKLYPYYAYAIGMYIRGEIPEGMYFTEDDYEHSIRNQPTENGLLLIVGGGHHKTGQGGITRRHYEEIEKYASDRFDLNYMKYYWSTEDFSTPDGVPFIGLAPKSKRIYMAAGFGGWGMTNGTVSATLISDLILGVDNRWSEFFDPSRFKIAAFGKESILEGINVFEQYAREYLEKPEKENLSALGDSEGAMVKAKDKKIAAYRDEGGKAYTLSPKCTHMGCPVNFNDAEKTWDCTCHGSRFSYDGTVIQGPAIANLPEEKIQKPA